MKNKLTISILFVIVQISLYPQFNYETSHTSFIGRWAGGRCLTNTSVGNYTYIGDGGIFKILNTSDPSNPTFLDSIVTPGIVQKITIVGTLAYVADGIGGLRIIDIEKPDSAFEISGYDSPGYAYSVAVSGTYAYLADGNSGVQVIDVSDSSSPTLATNVPFSRAYDISVQGNYAYVASSDLGLKIIDISTPGSSNIVGTFDTPGTAYGVDVIGSYAFVADGAKGLEVFNISTTTPIFLDSIGTPETARKVRVSGDYAFVTADYAGVRIIDITGLPSSTLTEAGYYDSPGKCYDVSINDTTLYVSDGGHSLRIANIKTITPNISQLSFYDTPSYSFGVDVQGNYAFIAGSGKGVRVIDISDLQTPHEVSAYNLDDGSYCYNIKVLNNLAFVANGGKGFLILDIGNKLNPSFVGSYYIPGDQASVDIDVNGNYAYIVALDSGLYIIDISDSSHPTQVGHLNTPGIANGVFVQGNFAYVADDLSGLEIIDISDKINPQLVGNYNTSGTALDVVVKNNLAFVADYSSGLEIIDVSDSSSPQIVGSSTENTIRARCVAVNQNLAFIGDENNGVQLFDISAAISPSNVGYLHTPSQGYGITVHNDTIFEADYDGGLMIIKNLVPTPVELSSFNAKYFGNSVALSWETATEINNYGFQVERKKENGKWTSLGFIHGNGNSNSIKKYSFVDQDFYGSSKWYYRLKQIDNSGSYKYSNTVEVNVVPSSFSLSQNYPNPFNPSTKIKYSLPIASHVKLVIYDILGNRIKTLVDKNQESGYYESQFNGLNLSSGVYIYQLKTDQFISSKKMILTK